MTNRLVLNLSHTANTREDSEFRTRTGLEPPIFVNNSILGNIGGPLRTLPDGFEDDEDILRCEEIGVNIDGERTKDLQGLEEGRERIITSSSGMVEDLGFPCGCECLFGSNV